ncbi:MAG TPA: alpha/beta fold hydrolase [Solirubrobacteraceae bacterium]|nr:alpha/beta fold hydrolase [Solirubrobacteraceae bacterium]
MSLNHHRGGSGEPLVLIHGIGSRWQVWNPVLPILEREREVIALDLPGFGASPLPPHDVPAGLESLRDSVIGLLDELGLERPHIAGNSLGGWLSLEVAKAGRAASATALSPAGFWTGLDGLYSRVVLFMAVRSSRLSRPYAEWLTASPARRRLAFRQFMNRPELMPAEDALLQTRGLSDAPWFDATLKAMIARRFQHGEQIDVPVTIAWAELDRILPPHQALWAAHLIPSARSSTLYGCGHVPTYDDPEQVANAILEGSA